MSFSEIAKRKPSNNPVCVVGAILAGLDDDERDHLRAMLSADIKVWPHTGSGSIQEAFEEEGYGTVGDKPIRSHRAGTCACFRD